MILLAYAMQPILYYTNKFLVIFIFIFLLLNRANVRLIVLQIFCFLVATLVAKMRMYCVSDLLALDSANAFGEYVTHHSVQLSGKEAAAIRVTFISDTHIVMVALQR